MNLDLNLLGKAADVLYIKLYNPDCQSQLIDCFYVKQCVALGCVVDCFKLSGWVFEEKKKSVGNVEKETGRILNPHYNSCSTSEYRQ